jgi:hypothetical protein
MSRIKSKLFILSVSAMTTAALLLPVVAEAGYRGP